MIRCSKLYGNTVSEAITFVSENFKIAWHCRIASRLCGLLYVISSNFLTTRQFYHHTARDELHPDMSPAIGFIPDT